MISKSQYIRILTGFYLFIVFHNISALAQDGGNDLINITTKSLENNPKWLLQGSFGYQYSFGWNPNPDWFDFNPASGIITLRAIYFIRNRQGIYADIVAKSVVENDGIQKNFDMPLIRQNHLKWDLMPTLGYARILNYGKFVFLPKVGIGYNFALENNLSDWYSYETETDPVILITHNRSTPTIILGISFERIIKKANLYLDFSLTSNLSPWKLTVKDIKHPRTLIQKSNGRQFTISISAGLQFSI